MRPVYGEKYFILQDQQYMFCVRSLLRGQKFAWRCNQLFISSWDSSQHCFFCI